jgi:protein O-GlcNAc transferase
MTSLAEAEDLILSGNPLLARNLLNTVLTEEPLNPAALHLTGLASIAAQDLNHGIVSLRRAAALSEDPDWLRDLGAVYLLSGAVQDAIVYLERAFEADPTDWDGRYLFAQALTACGRPKEALVILEGLEHAEGNSAVLRALGEASFGQGKFAAALTHFEKACALHPESAILHEWCAVLALSLSRFAVALSHRRRIVAIKPNECESLCALAAALWCAGHMEECRDVSRVAREMFPENEHTHINWLRAVDHTTFDPVESRTSWEQWAKVSQCSRTNVEILPEREWNPSRVLRVGYLIDEIHKRPNSYFIPPLLENQDRKSFHVICFLTAPKEADEWNDLTRLEYPACDVRSMSVEEIAREVRANDIDILVNVSWEFRNRNIGVFGHRAAPIQIELPHYPAASGHPETDFILVDRWVCPPGHERMYSETVCRLDESYMPWVLPSPAPHVTEPPCLGAKHCTFGMFQKPSKFNPLLWDTIAEVLHRVPSAELLIHNNSNDLDDPASDLRKRYAEELRIRGIASERVRYIGVREYEEHFSAIAECDIALDTFPYNGTTTTGDCLWMGVPVVTLAGATHAGRVGYSMLGRLGLEDFAAHSTVEYVNLAVRLAEDTKQLEALRYSLRDRMEKSPLTNARAVMSGIERQFRSIWQEHCQNKISVTNTGGKP